MTRRTEHFRTFREFEPRYAKAECSVNEGVELIHHCPIRRIKLQFDDTIEKHGMNSRVTILRDRPSWISHNMIMEPGKPTSENVLMIGQYNWSWTLEQLTGFSNEELAKIKKERLLTPFKECSKFTEFSKEMQECWNRTPFRYA